MDARNLEWTPVEELAFDEIMRAGDLERLSAISENGVLSPLVAVPASMLPMLDLVCWAVYNPTCSPRCGAA
jgi:hypothetical protein